LKRGHISEIWPKKGKSGNPGHHFGIQTVATVQLLQNCYSSTAWHDHHILSVSLRVSAVAIGNPERHVRKASHRGSKQQ